MQHPLATTITILFVLGLVAVFAILVVWAIRRRNRAMLLWIFTFLCLFAGMALFVLFATREAYLPAFLASLLGIPVPLTIIGIIDWCDTDGDRLMSILLWVLAASFGAVELWGYIGAENKTPTQHRCTTIVTEKGDTLFAKSDTTLFCNPNKDVSSVFTLIRNNTSDTLSRQDRCVCGRKAGSHYRKNERQMAEFYYYYNSTTN
ncbi:MAG: hypothetical protein IJP95_00680 [Bacteroidales bacterium]|nr:hypothetical protein [Bacteroidales bacterium]